MALAALLRLYRLDAQGVWIDEYQAVVFLDAPDLQTMVAIARFYLPENMPLYYVLFYAWAQLTDPGNIPLIRGLSVLTGVLCIPLIFAIGRRVFTARAGLIAALLLALSPFHIHFAQGLRYNIFLDFFALAAMYGLLRAASDEGRRWWLLHFAANAALLWTHPFVGTLYVAQGLFMLACRVSWRTCLIWGASHAVSIAIAGAWLMPSLVLMQGGEDDAYMQLPSLPVLAADIFADDALILSDPFAFQGHTWPWLPEGLARAYVALHPSFDLMLLAMGALVAVWASLAAWRIRQPGTVMALLWWLVPPLVLLLLSLTLRPMMLPRYTCFASLGFYVLAGGALCALPEVSARRGALAVLVGLYVYQIGLMLPAPTRTDWTQAARAVAQEAAPGDIVYVSGHWRSWEVFRFHAPPSLRSAPAPGLQYLATESARQLSSLEGPSQVWGVFQPFVFSHPPLAQFEAELNALGLDHEHRFYPGMNGLHVWRITRATEAASMETRAWDSPFEPEPFLQAMGFGDVTGAEHARMTAALHTAAQIPLQPTPVSLAYLSLTLAYLGEHELALAAAEASVAHDPGYSFGHFARAVVHGSAGDAAVCAEAFARTLEADGFGYFRLFQDLMAHLYINPAREAARDAAATLDAMGAYVPPVCLKDAGLLPQPGRSVWVTKGVDKAGNAVYDGR